MKLFLEVCREVAPKVAQVEQLVPAGEGSEAVRQSLADVSGPTPHGFPSRYERSVGAGQPCLFRRSESCVLAVC